MVSQGKVVKKGTNKELKADGMGSNWVKGN